MEDLDFTSRPAKSAIYDPAVARACFQSQGKVEIIAQGGQFFAETDCTLISINRADFLGLVKGNPGFAVSLLKAVAERLRYMTSRRA